ncbi:uncharacterized protein LOC117529341 [Thalassophryne amazonica]|uniref:uncharacterized protein LOC117529341 n=1 Tax=Thalassophryne amazonica TaxID=390379 RepID=UPI0014713AE5|nr:uncharacterized protein LOC117529341 [Thalassophryne amazonica]
MDDKLILAVFNYPELYNVTLPNYRSSHSRVNAWRSIGIALGLPAEDCKRKWKNLRDRYLKEVRTEIKSKHQGVTFQSRWKYRHLMNFIAPFTGSRCGLSEIYTNEEDHDNPDNESGSVEGETTPSEIIKSPTSIMKTPLNQPDPKPHIGFVTQHPHMPQDTQIAPLPILGKIPSSSQVKPISKIGQKRHLIKESFLVPPSQSTGSPSKWLVKDNTSSYPNRARDEDELFLLSFVPALKRLPPQKRCETKMKIQQIMYEAEFNDAQPEYQEKQTESETRD